MDAAILTSPSKDPATTDTRATHDPLALPEYALHDSHISHPVDEREFEYKVEKKKGVAVASLKVVAPAVCSKNIPTFFGTGPVKGTANLYLDEPDKIKSVIVSVRGRFLPGHPEGKEQLTLFNIENTLWSKDAEDEATDGHKKLSGTHSWPFSFDIPEKIPFTADHTSSQPTDHYTPQTFFERALIPSIRYEVILKVVRGRFENDYQIPCAIGYFPVIRPPPFPELRSIAYQNGGPLPDPTVDANGWVSAKNATISGTLSDSRSVDVDCQLFLSAPLAYSRGTVLPLFIRMESRDKTALDLLAEPKSIVVRLHRTIQYCPPMQSLKNPKHYHAAHDKRDLVEAVWWPASSKQQGEAQGHVVCLNGELHLRPELYPSTTLPVFTVDYHVCLRATNLPGFTTKSAEKSLAEHPVEIVTLSSTPGPHALRYAPPGYDEERPIKQEYGLALGLIGNPYD